MTMMVQYLFFLSIERKGNQCGVTQGYEDYKKIYFTNPDYMDKGQVDGFYFCVKDCPNGEEKIDCKPIKDVPSCNGKDVENYETI